MKKKNPWLMRVTALFLIAFILGGYFSFLSRYLGSEPYLVVKYLYFLGVFGSFFCAVIWLLLFLYGLVFPRADEHEE